MEDTSKPIMIKTKFSKKTISPVYVAVLSRTFVLILFGMLLGDKWRRQNMVLEENAIHYGVVDQNLNVQSIIWKDYPFRAEFLIFVMLIK